MVIQLQTLEKIEILSVGLLDQHRSLVNELKRMAQCFGLEFGWHYLLDYCWIIAHLGTVRGKRILDAGAGVGLLQWYLAEQGAEVLSVDRSSRATLPIRFRKRFQVNGMRKKRDLHAASHAMVENIKQLNSLRGRLSYLSREMIAVFNSHCSPGRVTIYNEDLGDLKEIDGELMDTVVALSSLEHNPPGGLSIVVQELMRVLKPGGCLLATVGVSKERDWLHEPSQGWCYSEKTLRRIFELPAKAPSNFFHYDELFLELLSCEELRDNLASFYFRSGDNGMPWGKWQPKYQSAGICKIKKG